MKTWTILLLRPDYVAATFGHDTILIQEKAADSITALAQARKAACEIDELDEQDPIKAYDYYCLFCCQGTPKNLVNGCGGVILRT